MKKRIFAFILTVVCFVVFAVKPEVTAANTQKSDLAVVLRALVGFSNAEEYEMDGEITVVTESNVFGDINNESVTTPVKGVFRDGKMYFYHGISGIADENSLAGLIRGVERDMLSNLIIIDDFASGGVRYLDVAVLDFADIAGIEDDIRRNLIDNLTSGEDAVFTEALRDIITPLLSSLSVEGVEFFRINTKTRKVTGIGINLTIDARFDFTDTPIEIHTEAEAFIYVDY